MKRLKMLKAMEKLLQIRSKPVADPCVILSLSGYSGKDKDTIKSVFPVLLKKKLI